MLYHIHFLHPLEMDEATLKRVFARNLNPRSARRGELRKFIRYEIVRDADAFITRRGSIIFTYQVYKIPRIIKF